jgi:hypothetical protein
MAKLIKDDIWNTPPYIKDTCIKDTWDLEDFRNVAKGYEEHEFSDGELLDAMELVVDNFDANYGITWETIEDAFDVIVWNRKQDSE